MNIFISIYKIFIFWDIIFYTKSNFDVSRETYVSNLIDISNLFLLFFQSIVLI